MGTIQPARFLTYTGDIKPGIRQVVQIPNPATATDFSVTVPGGQMWYIIGGYATFAASATVNSRYITFTETIDNIPIWYVADPTFLTASQFKSYAITAAPIPSAYAANGEAGLLGLMPGVLPSGSVFKSTTANISAGDQWSQIALYVEKYYFTDAQLSELEVAKEAAERALIAAELQQAGIGQGN